MSSRPGRYADDRLPLLRNAFFQSEIEPTFGSPEYVPVCTSYPAWMRCSKFIGFEMSSFLSFLLVLDMILVNLQQCLSLSPT